MKIITNKWILMFTILVQCMMQKYNMLCFFSRYTRHTGYQLFFVHHCNGNCWVLWFLHISKFNTIKQMELFILRASRGRNTKPSGRMKPHDINCQVKTIHYSVTPKNINIIIIIIIIKWIRFSDIIR